MRKLVFSDAMTVLDEHLNLDEFAKFGEVEVYPLTSAAEIRDLLSDARAVFSNKTPLNSETLAKAAHLQYIGVLATGYNNVDIPYATSRGITVCNAGCYATDSVAQHVFALILQHYNGVAFLQNYVQDGGWQKAPVFSPLVYPLQELAGKTLGIVGFGHIGQAVARLAQAFSMKVKVFTRSPGQEAGIHFVSWQQLLADSDIVTLHCPLTEETAGLFNAAAFANMKESALFVNTSRGGLVVEEDLAAALKNGVIAAACLDVLAVEPMLPTCPLIGAPHLFITPHVAWTPLEARKRLLDITAANFAAFLAGKPQNQVN